MKTQSKKEKTFKDFNLLTLFWRQSVGNFPVSFLISKFKVDQKVCKKQCKVFQSDPEFKRICTVQYSYSKITSIHVSPLFVLNWNDKGIGNNWYKRLKNIWLDFIEVLQKIYYQSEQSQAVFLNKK